MNSRSSSVISIVASTFLPSTAPPPRGFDRLVKNISPSSLTSSSTVGTGNSSCVVPAGNSIVVTNRT